MTCSSCCRSGRQVLCSSMQSPTGQVSIDGGSCSRRGDRTPPSGVVSRDGLLAIRRARGHVTCWSRRRTTLASTSFLERGSRGLSVSAQRRVPPWGLLRPFPFVRCNKLTAFHLGDRGAANLAGGNLRREPQAPAVRLVGWQATASLCRARDLFGNDGRLASHQSHRGRH